MQPLPLFPKIFPGLKKKAKMMFNKTEFVVFLSFKIKLLKSVPKILNNEMEHL